MIGRRFTRKSELETQVAEPKSFDDFELRLGDLMRGERATMGKSLLDVQRELRIKASYIAAIENSDTSAFDTPGFIAGYVRSYSRYLGMDPDESFATFCRESGFSVAHGMSAEASVVKKASRDPAARAYAPRDPFTMPNTPFAPVNDGFFSQIEPRAIGSTLVLLTLICGIGYGGWSVLKEVQQVQFAPVDQVPLVLSDLDPVDSAARPAASSGMTAPGAEAMDRLYRPQALDLPVMVARDAPISTLDPRTVGSFAAPQLPDVQMADSTNSLGNAIDQLVGTVVPRVVEDSAPQLRMVAVRPSWVRVSAPDGSVIFEGIMESGQSYEVPMTEEPPNLRAGESGAIYFTLDGQDHFGPVGSRGTVTSNLPLSIATVMERFEIADLDGDRDLARMVAEAQTGQ